MWLSKIPVDTKTYLRRVDALFLCLHIIEFKMSKIREREREPITVLRHTVAIVKNKPLIVCLVAKKSKYINNKLHTIIFFHSLKPQNKSSTLIHNQIQETKGNDILKDI